MVLPFPTESSEKEQKKRKRNAHLDSTNAGKSPEVTIANPVKLGLDLFHQCTSDVETIVCTVKSLRFEAHCSIVTART